MAKRIKAAQPGDIFKVTLEDKEVGFFQYMLLDPCQLNSEVIRVFRYRSKEVANYNLEEIAKSDVDFYAHVVIPFGYDLDLWEKIGNVPLEKGYIIPLFRDTSGIKHEFEGRKIIYKKTDQWQVWRAGDPFDFRKKLGWITEENESIDLGMVKAPLEIIHKMKTGEYSFPYYT